MSNVFFVILGIIAFAVWVWTGVNNDIKAAKLVYVTGLAQEQIIEIMNRHNVKDLLMYDFYYDESVQKYILFSRAIREDYLQYEAKMKYEFTMQTRGQVVVITLLQVWTNNVQQIRRYKTVISKFMEEKLQARYLDRTQGKEFY